MGFCKLRFSSSRYAAMMEKVPSPVAVMMFCFLVSTQLESSIQRRRKRITEKGK